MDPMRAFALTLALATAPAAAPAQEMDSVFASYEDYAGFVDRHMMRRDFIPLVLRLGGRDEYTAEELELLEGQLLRAFPINFFEVAVFRETDLGGGFRQEARAYWTGVSYAWFYALLHDRGRELVVVNFLLNSDAGEILKEF